MEPEESVEYQTPGVEHTARDNMVVSKRASGAKGVSGVSRESVSRARRARRVSKEVKLSRRGARLPSSLGETQPAARALVERFKLSVAQLTAVVCSHRPLSPAAVVGGAVGGGGRRGGGWLRQVLAAISVVMGCGDGLR